MGNSKTWSGTGGSGLVQAILRTSRVSDMRVPWNGSALKVQSERDKDHPAHYRDETVKLEFTTHS